MPRYKDFEIWFDEETQRYRFSVEYWGSYGAKTLEEIHEKRNRVKGAVARRLKDIERQNKEYYKKLALKEAILKRELKEARNKQYSYKYVKFKDLDPSKKAKLIKMILSGADELQIKNKISVNSGTIAALKNKREKNVHKNIQENETISNAGGGRIIMPSYTADVVRGERLSDK